MARPLALPTFRSLGAASAIAVTALMALQSGCAVGPDFHRPAAPTVNGYTPQPLASDATPGAPTLVVGQEIPAEWWTLFHSPALNAMIVQALKANPDLEAAKAALRAAQQTYYAQRAAFLPTVQADYNVTRQQASGTPAPPLNSGVNLFTLHTAQVTVAYTLDVFGGVRRQTEQVGAQTEQQKYETDAAYLTLTSNVVAAAIQEASLRDQVAATKEIIRSDRDVLDLMRRQFQVGQIARADLAAQEAAVFQAEQALPPLEKQLAQTGDLIADLTGRFPSEAPDDQLDLSSLTLPDQLPVSLPSKLVDQRPDIRAAEANLHAASAGIGVAIANRLPTFTLTANAGGAATSLANLFSNGNGFWSVAGDVSQPIFEGGALYHRQKAAEALYDQAKAQYRSAVLAAIQNVADTLQALQADARAYNAAAATEASTAESLTIAKRQLELGQVSGVTVLTAEQAYQTARMARVQAAAARYADAAALFQSLGGGWWNRPGEGQPEAQSSPR
jgi:NodT family efflux transporter outer membrane factor (OMF) lipoprotein